MRVISGRFKGVALTTPKSGTRPTTDRTKEAIFSHLDSWGVLDDARVLDLFAGTGALGIEALSRGARELVAVESSAPAAALIAQTLTALKHNRSWEHGMSARVVKARAEKYASSASAVEPFDFQQHGDHAGTIHPFRSSRGPRKLGNHRSARLWRNCRLLH